MKPKIKKVLLVGSTILGAATASNRILAALNEMDDIHADSILFSKKDLKAIQLPSVLNSSQAAKVYYVLKEKLSTVNESYDAVIFITIQAALAVNHLKGKPMVSMRYDSLSSHGSLSSNKSLKDRALDFVSKHIYQRTFKKIDYLLPHSHWCAKQNRHYSSLKNKPYSICYTGLDENRWKPLPNKTKQHDTITVLFMGNDCRRKGILDFFHYLHKNNGFSHGLKFKVLTNDPNKDIDQWAAHASITLVRGLTLDNQTEIISAYQHADIFLFPTFHDQMGNVLIEASMVGLPIIASDIAAVGEAVKDNVNGFLVQAGNFSAVYQKLMLLVNDSVLRQQFSENSRAHAVQHFSKAHFISVIRQAIGAT